MTPPLSPDQKANVEPHHLPAELLELILVITVRLTAITSHWDLPTTGRLLCVLPREQVPSPTKALFLQFPWLDVHHVSRFDCASTLQFLLDWSNKPNGRPICDLTSVKPSVIDRATACGSIDSLNWWFFDSGLPVGEWSGTGLEQASAAGHMHVLRWWFASGKKLMVTVQATIKAATNGYLPVLEFWLQHHGAALFTESVIQAAVEAGHLHIVKWWLNVGLDMNLANMLATALKHSQLDILSWVTRQPSFSRALEGNAAQTTNCVDSALSAPATLSPLLTFHIQAAGGKLTDGGAPEPSGAVLDELWTNVLREGDLVKVLWLHRLWQHPASKTNEPQMIEQACTSGNIQLLDWIRSTFSHAGALQDVVETQAFEIATVNGHIHVLEWLVAHGYCPRAQVSPARRSFAPSRGVMRRGTHRLSTPIITIENCFSLASAAGRIDVLKWWVKFPKYTNRPIKEAMKHATQKGQLAVLDWWRDESGYFHTRLDFSELPDLFTAAINDLGETSLDVLDWWLNKSQLGWQSLPKAGPALVAASEKGLVSVVQLLWQSHVDSLTSSSTTSSMADTAMQGLLAASRNAQIGCMDWWWAKSGAILQPTLFEFFKASNAQHHPDALPWWESVLGAGPNQEAPNVVRTLRASKGRATPAHWLMLARMGIRIKNTSTTVGQIIGSGDTGMLAYMYLQYGQDLKLDVSLLGDLHDTRVLDWLHSRTVFPIMQMVRNCQHKSMAVRQWLSKGTSEVHSAGGNLMLDFDDDDDNLMY